MIRVAIIMVSFGRPKLLALTLSSLFNTTTACDADVYTIDNGSDPNTVALLMSYQDKISHLVLLNANYGKPYAHNLGVRMADELCFAQKKTNYDYYLFCDSDLIFKPGWLNKLLATYEEHRHLPLGALSAFAWMKGTINIQSGPSTQINIQRFTPGCCMLIARDVFHRIGWFDTKRLIRCVDTSWMKDAIAKGFQQASVAPESLVEHIGQRQRTWGKDGKPILFTD